jgi:regulator of protease activity HflC (stomatin/prohibitin superfamily)
MPSIGSIGTVLFVAVSLSGCATIVKGHERALFYSASSGMSRETVGSGWHWHAPWNHYVKYDLRWQQHREEIHIHSMDGLHMDLGLVVVVRPKPNEIYALDSSVGPTFYDQVVRPAVFAAARDASGQFKHLDIATKTHSVERAIHKALLEHLAGQHIEVAEVAIQQFHLPGEVEQAANRTAASSQLLAAKDVDLQLAHKEADIDKEKRRGLIEAKGLERQLHDNQELAHAEQQQRIEQANRRSARERVESQAEQLKIRADSEAQAVRLRAAAEKERIQSEAQVLTPNYLRLKGMESLAKALSGPNEKIFVMPVGKDGFPRFFTPFLNPLETLPPSSSGKARASRAEE